MYCSRNIIGHIGPNPFQSIKIILLTKILYLTEKLVETLLEDVFVGLLVSEIVRQLGHFPNVFKVQETQDIFQNCYIPQIS